MRITAPERAGRALAIAMTGIPAALAAGTPLGTWLGTAAGWRWAFAAMSVFAVIVIIGVLAFVPDAPGQHEQTRVPFAKALRIPGVVTILGVAVVWMFAHNLLYAYIAAYLQQAHLHLSTDVALVIFGVAAIAGIAITGMLVDRMLRRLTLASVALFIVTGAILLAAQGSVPFAILALVLWGIGFGGSATQLQTAAGGVAGDNADAVVAMVATCFNLGIFVSGIVGAVVVDRAGARAIPVAMIVLAALVLIAVGSGRRAAFPSGR
jgi:predicted MFS family arabinose efflux permease